MKQLTFFGKEINERVVNVASVPHRSPFRYPGGKTWLVPRIRQWLGSKNRVPETLIEPFAGGGIIGLTAAFERLADFVVLVELDADVASVWNIILHGDTGWLIRRIADFEMTLENVREELNKSAVSTKERAFQTILKNRTYHGGILAPGSGLIKNGENGKGIKSRWYPETLCKRIANIVAVKERIKFIEADGLDIMQENAGKPDTVYFIDPPYTAAGKKAGTRLYNHFNLDHERLFDVAQELCGDFLMTYDNAGGVKDLARKHGFATRAIAMKNTHHAKMTELLIGRDLRWLL